VVIDLKSSSTFISPYPLKGDFKVLKKEETPLIKLFTVFLSGIGYYF
jgi:hypothetical protein